MKSHRHKDWMRMRRASAVGRPFPQIVAARVLSAVHPQVPGDFLASHLFREKDELVFRALFTIRADGSFGVEMTASTGNEALDALALRAAQQWQFAPATKNGIPISSYLRLRIEFEAL